MNKPSVYVLALDGSETSCSVALMTPNKCVLRQHLVQRQHAEVLLPMVDSLFHECALSSSCLHAIAFSKGPGAFTGLRIIASAAQGLAAAWGVQVIGVSSLMALAHRAHRLYGAEYVIAMMDARMGELYIGVAIYRDQRMQWLAPESICPINQLDDYLRDLKLDYSLPWHIIGSGWLNTAIDVRAVAALFKYLCWAGELTTVADAVAELALFERPLSPPSMPTAIHSAGPCVEIESPNLLTVAAQSRLLYLRHPIR